MQSTLTAAADSHAKCRRESVVASARTGVSACRHTNAEPVGDSLLSEGVGAPTSSDVFAWQVTPQTVHPGMSARRHLLAPRAVPRPARPFRFGARGTRLSTKVHPTPS
jgi:hypothetical protein